MPPAASRPLLAVDPPTTSAVGEAPAVAKENHHLGRTVRPLIPHPRPVLATRCLFRPSRRQVLRDAATTRQQTDHQVGPVPVVASLDPRGIVGADHEAVAGTAVPPARVVVAAASARIAITAMRRRRPVAASRRARAVDVAGRDALRS